MRSLASWKSSRDFLDSSWILSGDVPGILVGDAGGEEDGWREGKVRETTETPNLGVPVSTKDSER